MPSPSTSRVLSRTAVGRMAGSMLQKVRGRSAALATGRFLRRQLWAWPILAATIVGVTGWLVIHAVEDALRERRAAEMQTILAADVAALKEWMHNQKQTAEMLAATAGLEPLVTELVAVPAGTDAGKNLLQAPAQAKLKAFLAPLLVKYRYTGYIVSNPDGLVVAADVDSAVGKVLVGPRKEFYGSVSAGEVRVSKPMKSLVLLPDKDGELRANVATMFAAAPVRDTVGKPFAALAFRLRPEEDFSRILQTARAGETGETYAFDRSGMMLSNSRFDEDMKQIGLLVDEGTVQSALTLELRNPGADLTAGGRPRIRRKDMPFTKPVQMATTEGDGHDVDGYRDYRGTPTLGAWTWLPEYDFGVVTEVDSDEAHRPVYILRRAFAVLLGLLVLAAVGIFVVMLMLARKQSQLREAVLEAKQLGQYTLEDKLGAGGMGTVYRARHAMLRRPTAVKLLDIGKMSDTAVARFEREVQLTATLTHPNTVQVFDYGRTPEGVFYYAMEYLDGVNLDDLVVRHGPLPEARAMHLLTQLCGALAEAHHAGMVHRDIKPANVFLTLRGGMHDFVKVLDFGLVKTADEGEANLTAANAVTGTPLYLSPEGITNPDAVDARADVYAVGAVAYFLLTGQPPFTAKSVSEILMKHVGTPPEPLNVKGVTVSPGFEALILRCLAKSPAERPVSAAALLLELEACAVSGVWNAATAAVWWRNLPSSRPATASTPTPPATLHTAVVPAPTAQVAEMTQVFTDDSA